MQVNVYTVSQINGYIRRLIDNDVFLSQLYIEGEISNLILHPSGHIYFSLKDSTGAINCVMFRSYAEKLAFMPENGGAVLAGGRVSLYEKTGKYQFYVDYMQPAGKGKLYLAFEELKKRLEAEGLFDSSKKKPIPQFPKTIAVVTSPSGAAVRDIINVAGRRDPSVRLVIMPVLVQGENAAEDIARGIALVNEWGGADTIIVGRGGGSMEASAADYSIPEPDLPELDFGEGPFIIFAGKVGQAGILTWLEDLDYENLLFPASAFLSSDLTFSSNIMAAHAWFVAALIFNFAIWPLVFP